MKKFRVRFERDGKVYYEKTILAEDMDKATVKADAISHELQSRPSVPFCSYVLWEE